MDLNGHNLKAVRAYEAVIHEYESRVDFGLFSLVGSSNM